jgi:hypothetical protein|tara:strand:+ start:522 stop:662 length:141 start_codon:yes stop_codon:yes gene_type:complete
MNIDNDIAFLIILLATNMGTYYYSKHLAIRACIEYLEKEGYISFDD